MIIIIITVDWSFGSIKVRKKENKKERKKIRKKEKKKRKSQSDMISREKISLIIRKEVWRKKENEKEKNKLIYIPRERIESKNEMRKFKVKPNLSRNNWSLLNFNYFCSNLV